MESTVTLTVTFGNYKIRESGKIGFLVIENWETDESITISESVFEEYLKNLIRIEK